MVKTHLIPFLLCWAVPMLASAAATRPASSQGADHDPSPTSLFPSLDEVGDSVGAAAVKGVAKGIEEGRDRLYRRILLCCSAAGGVLLVVFLGLVFLSRMPSPKDRGNNE